MFKTKTVNTEIQGGNEFRKLSALVKLAKGYRTINGFAADARITNPDYIEDIINCKVNAFPQLQFLEKIADNSQGRVTLKELKIACGYSLYDDRNEIKNIFIKRGWLCYVNLGEVIDSVSGGFRPAVIVQNDIGNKFSSTTLICPITSKLKRQMPTHVSIGFECGLTQESEVTVEQMRVISKRQLAQDGYVQKIGEAPDWLLRKIEIAIMKETGIVDINLEETIIERALNKLEEIGLKHREERKKNYEYQSRPQLALV